jgi:hypothetical protein
VALGLAPAAAFAQEEAGPPGESRREEAFRMVDAYLVSNLQESLGLTEEQYVKVLPLVNKLQTARREFFMARWRLVREMRRSLRSGSATEAQVLEKLKELKELETEGPARTRSQMEALDAALTPIQQAKYRLLELEVEQRMRELMGHARQPRGGRTPREPK